MLTLYYHPLSSFCWKALIALYEHEIAFTPELIDLGDPASRGVLEQVWPIAKFPVLRDGTTGLTIPESSVIIEYLDTIATAHAPLVDKETDAALQTRLWDRFYDQYIQVPMQKIVADRIRAEDARDAQGVAEARALLAKAFDLANSAMTHRRWATGDRFGLADCAAAPALYYANRVQPFGSSHPSLAAYLDRLSVRPSFARVLEEAAPYLHMFPAA